MHDSYVGRNAAVDLEDRHVTHVKSAAALKMKHVEAFSFPYSPAFSRTCSIHVVTPSTPGLIARPFYLRIDVMLVHREALVPAGVNPSRIDAFPQRRSTYGVR